LIRLALPKGRNLDPTLQGLRAAGLALDGLGERRLRQAFPEEGVEVLLLKDWDLPLYIEQGIADCGVVGTDVLEELGSDLLVPLRFRAGRCRMSLIGTGPEAPRPGDQIRVATKYPRWTERLLRSRPWGVEIFKLSGSVELGPLLELAEIAVDIVQTGSTIREHHLHEIEVLAEVAPCLVVNRAAYQRHRSKLNGLFRRLEEAEVVGP
jgi:ATP phosphoribosyltransferase